LPSLNPSASARMFERIALHFVDLFFGIESPDERSFFLAVRAAPLPPPSLPLPPPRFWDDYMGASSRSLSR